MSKDEHLGVPDRVWRNLALWALWRWSMGPKPTGAEPDADKALEKYGLMFIDDGCYLFHTGRNSDMEETTGAYTEFSVMGERKHVVVVDGYGAVEVRK